MAEAIDVWPKKMPAGEYRKRWYVARSQQSIINDIRGGKSWQNVAANMNYEPKPIFSRSGP